MASASLPATTGPAPTTGSVADPLVSTSATSGGTAIWPSATSTSGAGVATTGESGSTGGGGDGAATSGPAASV